MEYNTKRQACRLPCKLCDSSAASTSRLRSSPAQFELRLSCCSGCRNSKHAAPGAARKHVLTNRALCSSLSRKNFLLIRCLDVWMQSCPKMVPLPETGAGVSRRAALLRNFCSPCTVTRLSDAAEQATQVRGKHWHCIHTALCLKKHGRPRDAAAAGPPRVCSPRCIASCTTSLSLRQDYDSIGQLGSTQGIL